MNVYLRWERESIDPRSFRTLVVALEVGLVKIISVSIFDFDFYETRKRVLVHFSRAILQYLEIKFVKIIVFFKFKSLN